MFLPLFCAADLETSNGEMPAARELTMLNRLLIEHGVEYPIRNIRVNVCLLVHDAHSVYGAARELHNERTGNTLKHSPIQISGGRHLKARSLVLKASLLDSQFDSK